MSIVTMEIGYIYLTRAHRTVRKCSFRNHKFAIESKGLRKMKKKITKERRMEGKGMLDLHVLQYLTITI